MLEVKNLGQFKAQTDAWLKNVKTAAEEAAVGLAKRTFEKILYLSPQWSGDMVGNWKVFYGTPEYDFKPKLFPGHQYPDGEPFERGNLTPIRYAMSQATWTPHPLGTSIYLTNCAAHTDNETWITDPYSWWIELGSGLMHLRPVNAGAYYNMRRAKEFVQHRYAKIDASKLATLRRF